MAFFLEHWGAAARDGTNQFAFREQHRVHAEKDFSLFGADELEEISRVARRIVRRLARRPSRRWRTCPARPKILLRRMLRRSLTTGGELIELSFRRRKQRKTQTGRDLDVSGSMDIYSRILLQFVYGLQNSFARVETFVFSTSLERITPHLKRKTTSRLWSHYRQRPRLVGRHAHRRKHRGV